MKTRHAVALSVLLSLACGDRVVGTAQNTPPVLTVPGAQSVNEGEQLVFNVSASDAQEDHLSLQLTGAPAAVLFDADKGEVKWTPGFADAGAYEWTFTVSDGRASAEAKVQVTVVDFNRPPVFTPPPAASVREGELVNILLAVSDPDGDDIAGVTGSGGPFDIEGADALVSPVDGHPVYKARFSWRPSCRDGGEALKDYEVTFTAADAKGAEATTSTFVSVENVNCPPLISVSSPAATVAENAEFTMQVTATDPDGSGILFFTAEGGPLEEGHAENPPQHRRAAFTAAPENEGGELNWTPGCRDAGVYVLTFTAVDRTGKSTEETAGIEVTPIACALVPDAPAAVDGEERTGFGFNFAVDDPEGDAPSIEWTGAPPFFNGGWGGGPGRAAGGMGGYADCLSAGEYTIDFTFRGTLDRVSTSSTLVRVADKDCPPVINEVQPWTSPLEGGREIRLIGENLIAGTTVSIGGSALASSEVISASDSNLVFRAPSKSAPTVVEVTVDNHESTSTGGPKKLYYYRLKAVGGIDWGLPRAAAGSSRSESVFAAVFSSLFYVSVDGGATWERRGPQAYPWSAPLKEYLVFDATSDEILYYAGAINGSAVWVSTDQARSFAKLAGAMPGIGCGLPGDGPPAPYSGIAQATGGGIYVAVSSGCGAGAWRSPAPGGGWTFLPGEGADRLPDASTLPSYLAIASAPSNRDRVYLASGSGLYRTSDAGAKWKKTTGDPSGGIVQLAVDPQNADHVFALTDSGVFESANMGDDWTLLSAIEATGGELAVARGASEPKATVYVATAAALWASPDNGATASKRDTAPPTRKFLAATTAGTSAARAVAMMAPPEVPGSPWNIFPLAEAALRTFDRGATWTDASKDLSGAGVDRLVVTRGGDLAALSGGLIWTRPVGQARFARSSTAMEYAGDLAASTVNDHTVFALKVAWEDYFYRSTDAGATFVNKTPAPNPNIARYGLLLSASGGKVHVMTDHYPSFMRYMLSSSNEGDTWTETYNPPHPGEGDLINGNGPRWYVDHVNDGYFWFLEPLNPGYGASFRWSTDRGATGWNHATPPLHNDYLLGSPIYVDRFGTTSPATRLVLVVGCPGFCNGWAPNVLRNANGGATGFWTERPTPAAPTPYRGGTWIGGFGQARPSDTDAARQDIFLAGSTQGLLISFDRAVNWKKMWILDQPHWSTVNHIEEDPTRPNTFVLATKDGITGYGAYGSGIWELEIPLP
jgi:hypothetical protein